MTPWKQALFSQGATDADLRNHWATPPEVFAPLHAEFGFTLDAAATAATAQVPDYLGPDHPDLTRRDAHTADWSPAGPTWLNPPYGRNVGKWLALAANWGQRQVVVVLVFSRTDTRWWWSSVFGRDPATGKRVAGLFSHPCAAEVRFRPGRIRFIDPSTGSPGDAAPAPSCLIVFRPGYDAEWPELGVL